MKVLLAAADSHLDYARAELSNWRFAKTLELTEVPAPVTSIAVTRALREDTFDLVVFIGHGSLKGILLDQGDILDYGILAPFIRGRTPYLFLNTCESEELAESIAKDSGAAVICTIGTIDDSHAYAVGSMLAYWLDLGHGFETAAQMAIPCDIPKGEGTPGYRGFKYIPAPSEGGTFQRLLRVIA